MTCLLGFGSELIDVSFNVIHDDKVGRSVQRLTMISVLQQKKEAHLDLFCIQIEKLIRLANRSIAMFAPGYRR